MRIVRSNGQMREALEQASAEASKNFGSPDVYFEKFIEEPRHVEVQLFGDQHGNVVHFGTRDCSAQRRHQKLVEEAPAPFLDPGTRERIHNAAVNAAKSVGYYNAGTAEFLVKGNHFYFLEINTRIQVEHPVTEAITGVDLVQLQLKVAMGEPLPFEQKDITFTGHAIELRINAENALEGFRPVTGPIGAWKRKPMPLVREDFGYEAHDTVPPYYDSLMSKIIVSGATRAEALARTYQYLRDYEIQGIPTSIPFHIWILSRPEFQSEGIDIGFVERTFTAEGAKEAMSMHRLDPSHVPIGVSGEVHTERVHLPDSHGEYTAIDLLHEPGGTFLAIPLTSSGTRTQKAAWRRSSSRVGAIEAIRAAPQ
jgi:acetyl-CoA carboxylase biotin carboxylase subunit